MEKTTKRTFEKPMQIRVAADQYQIFQKAAAKDGRTLSNWARDRLIKTAQKELGQSVK